MACASTIDPQLAWLFRIEWCRRSEWPLDAEEARAEERKEPIAPVIAEKLDNRELPVDMKLPPGLIALFVRSMDT